MRKLINKYRIRGFAALVIAAVLAGLDQLFKHLVVNNIEYRGQTVTVIDGILDITHWHNPGAAFGILSGRQTLLIAITGVFLLGAVVFLLSGSAKSKRLIAAVSLIIAGGAGNLIDRISQGYVVDYIELKFINFAIFNFADICAVTGAFLLFYAVVADEIREYKARKACDDSDYSEFSEEDSEISANNSDNE